MSKWIDADALPRHGQRGGLVHWKDIAEAPSIDIVRCKECKYAEIYDGYYTQVCCENGVIGGHGELWNPDDFCSYGERESNSGKPNNCEEQNGYQTFNGTSVYVSRLENELQTDNGIGCSRCEGRFECIDRDMPHAVHCNNYGKVTDEPQTDCDHMCAQTEIGCEKPDCPWK